MATVAELIERLFKRIQGGREHAAVFSGGTAEARPREREAPGGGAASEAPRMDEDRQRLVREATGLGTWDYNPVTGALQWDARCRELFGVGPDAPVELDGFFARIHPDDREHTRAGVGAALRPGGSGTYSQEFRITGLPGGATRWLASTGRAFFDANGRAVRFLGMVVDITERVHEREATQRERHRVVNVLESISDAFIAFDTRWRFTYVNREAERLLGQPREQLLGRNHWEVFPATRGTPVEHYYKRAAEERVPQTFENHYAPWDRWFELRVYPTDEGAAVYFHDVTDKKRGESEREALLRDQVLLREEAERALRELQLAVEVLEHGDAVFVVDKDYRFILVNENEERIARMPREQLLGRTLWELFPQAAAPESKYWTEYRRVVEQRVPVRFEEYYAPLDVWASVSAYPTRSGGMAAFIRDVTEQKRAEQFQERLLGIVSHDLRNPLQNILLTTELLLRREGVQEAVLAGVRRIAGSADRMQRMISDLLDFTRASVGGGIPLERQPVGLWAVVEATLQEFELTHPGRVTYTRARGMREGLWDADRLGQVVSNLVANALAYGDERQPVDVRVWDEDAWSVLCVHNAGTPIPEELLPRIFDPFKQATREGPRRGLGLGLYIVQQLVLAHGGTITVRSTQEEGTLFTVRLPHGAAR